MLVLTVTITKFQSYRDPTTIRLDPAVTLVAGRNDSGKSALLRALRAVAEPQEGIAQETLLSYVWSLSRDEMLRLALPGDVTSVELERWFGQADTYTLSAELTPNGPPANKFFCRRLEIAELDAVAEGELGTQIGWKSGTHEGTSIGTDRISDVALALAGMVSFVTPRRVEQGPQMLHPLPTLEPDARNLTNVVAYLISNERPTTFRRLEDFMRTAFPEITTVAAWVADRGSGTPQHELHTLYEGREDRPIPMRFCGSGIEQLLALATGIYTARTPRLFLIDEPQAYLHPHAERSLLRLLEQNPQHQYVVATHSAVFLNARPLNQSRLLTIANGETRVADAVTPAQLLGELGVTAADLWLAESILWVEGPSDASVISLVAAVALEGDADGIAIHSMPVASRFASTNPKRAQETFRFCQAVVEAVAPLPIKMVFLFDRDEKSKDLQDQIEQASGGRARFLPTRELENLLLDIDGIYEEIAERCNEIGLVAPARAEVGERLEAYLEDVGDSTFFARAPRQEESPEDVVSGSQVLARLYWDFAQSEYDKVDDGRRLAARLVRRGSARLDPLVGLLRELIDSPES
jgi:energy-coupling factor transporter ATP-binding protein EcfA2